jgi:hypothetical protein
MEIGRYTFKIELCMFVFINEVVELDNSYSVHADTYIGMYIQT